MVGSGKDEVFINSYRNGPRQYLLQIISILLPFDVYFNDLLKDISKSTPDHGID